MLKKIIINSIPILLILIVGIFLYFYKLEKIPNGFYIDEALPSYNAYSLLLTGKDEFGKTWPLVLRFYGSYNPFLYTYLTIFPIKFLGLTIFAARSVSALSGLLAVLVFYGILRSIGLIKSRIVIFISTFLMLISPWLILHSRVGYEVSLAFLFLLLGVWFLWLSIKNQPIFFILGILFFDISTYAAYAERFIAPLILISFLIVFRKKILSKNFRKYLIWGILIGFFFEMPNVWLITTPAFFPKGDLFSSDILIAQTEKILLLPKIIKIILAFLREFFSQYFLYFSPNSLFYKADHDLQRSIPEISVLYSWMIVPYLFGLYDLWKKRKKNISKYIFLLLLISPIPASLTKDPFSSHRALPLLLPIMLVVAFGVDFIVKKRKNLSIVVLFLLCFISLVFLYRSYFVLLPSLRAKDWQFGFEQLATIVNSNQNEKFVFDQSRNKPGYINIAFFLKYSPQKLQNLSPSTLTDHYFTGEKFDIQYTIKNIEFRPIVWEKDIYKNQILVGDELTFSESQVKEHFLTKSFEIRDPINQIIFLGYKTNPTKKCYSEKTKNILCSESSK
ncbi:MAG: hypothetical protein HY044_02790 [Candidatus Woesebacteria bacterium]|nr:MAG: hypothetical protein HY044_02790 [Candidatus Woesebacteria bacterium]